MKKILTLILCLNGMHAKSVLNKTDFDSFLLGYERGFEPSLDDVSLGAQLDIPLWTEDVLISLRYFYSWRASTSYLNIGRVYFKSFLLFNQYFMIGTGLLLRHREFGLGAYFETGIGLFKSSDYLSVDLIYRLNLDFFTERKNSPYPTHVISIVFNIF